MKPLGLQLPEHSGHGLDRPDDAAENEIGVEYAQCDLRGVLLCVADCGDDEADGGAADPLQHGQKEHQEQGTLIGNLESEIKKAIIKWICCFFAQGFIRPVVFPRILKPPRGFSARVYLAERGFSASIYY